MTTPGQLQYDSARDPRAHEGLLQDAVQGTFDVCGRPHQPRSVRRRHRGLTGSVRGASGARDSYASSANSACASQVTGVEDGDAGGSFELRRQADSRKPRAGERDDRCAFFAQASSRRDSGVLTCGRVQIARVANAVGHEVRQQTLAQDARERGRRVRRDADDAYRPLVKRRGGGHAFACAHHRHARRWQACHAGSSAQLTMMPSASCSTS